MRDAFFLRDGERFRSTEHVRGPWSERHQHGGPPAALMAGAMERLAATAGMRVTRMTVEFLSPVPIAPLEVGAAVVRAGRKARRLEASLVAEGAEVCRATALALRIGAVHLPPRVEPAPAAPPGPEASAPFHFPFFSAAVGYHTAVEGRVARGRWGAGPAAMWLRPRLPLIDDEPVSPLERVMIVADSGNGVAVTLDATRFTFVNPDLTVALDREPEGEWTCLEAATRTHPDGIGLSDTMLWDTRGPIGRSVQMLLVERRSEGSGRRD